MAEDAKPPIPDPGLYRPSTLLRSRASSSSLRQSYRSTGKGLIYRAEWACLGSLSAKCCRRFQENDSRGIEQNDHPLLLSECPSMRHVSAVSKGSTKGPGRSAWQDQTGVLAKVCLCAGQVVRVHCFQGEWTFWPDWPRLPPVPNSDACFAPSRQRRRPTRRNTLHLNLSSVFGAS